MSPARGACSHAVALHLSPKAFWAALCEHAGTHLNKTTTNIPRAVRGGAGAHSSSSATPEAVRRACSAFSAAADRRRSTSRTAREASALAA